MSTQLAQIHSSFAHPTYLARKKILSFLGQKFHLYAPDGTVAAFVKKAAFKLKEDIRVFSDESMTEQLLAIRARQILDFSACYDVFDTKTNQKVGALKRKGLKSILKDEWVVLDANDGEIGLVVEDSAVMAMLRRLLSNLIPQNFDMLVGGERVADFKQRFNPFVFKMDVDFTMDPMGQRCDRRLGIAAVILLLAIEGRQG
jgi:uncharacterized protein YxjI